jgi:PmbA protein
MTPSPPRRKESTDGDALLGRAERVVERARSRGVPQAECWMEWGEGLDVEIQKGAIANTGASQGGGGGVRVVVDGRVGFAYFTRERDAPGAIALAVRASRHAEALGFSLPSPARAGPLGGRWDPDAAALDTADAMRMAGDLLGAAKGSAPKATVAGGGVSIDADWCAIASTEGAAAWDRSTGVTAAASLVQGDRGRSVAASESRVSHRLGLDAAGVADAAAATLTSLLRPGPAPAGRLEVLFRPEAVAELVTDLAISACLGDEARRGKTVWSDRLGHAVASPRLSIADDPRAPRAVGGAPFDAEGLPTRRLPIIDKGRLRTFLYDAWDAHRHRARPTRSAVRGDFKNRPTTGTHHVTLAVSGARPLQRLVAGIDDGLLVDSVLGAHTANATTGDFSVTAPNVWRIQGGDVAGPVREVALSGNLPALLLRLGGASTEAKQMDGLRVPHLLFGDVDVSA